MDSWKYRSGIQQHNDNLWGHFLCLKQIAGKSEQSWKVNQHLGENCWLQPAHQLYEEWRFYMKQKDYLLSSLRVIPTVSISPFSIGETIVLVTSLPGNPFCQKNIKFENHSDWVRRCCFSCILFVSKEGPWLTCFKICKDKIRRGTLHVGSTLTLQSKQRRRFGFQNVGFTFFRRLVAIQAMVPNKTKIARLSFSIQLIFMGNSMIAITLMVLKVRNKSKWLSYLWQTTLVFFPKKSKGLKEYRPFKLPQPTVLARSQFYGWITIKLA